jgi:hypothetical protein
MQILCMPFYIKVLSIAGFVSLMHPGTHSLMIPRDGSVTRKVLDVSICQIVCVCVCVCVYVCYSLDLECPPDPIIKMLIY